METHQRTDCTSALGRVVYTMNCEVCRTTKTSSYKLVFAVSPLKVKVLAKELFEACITEETNAENLSRFKKLRKVKVCY